MLMKKPEYKRFEYIPRYYKPENDKQQKLKDRFEIVRRSHLFKRNNRNIFFYLVIIILVIYLLIKSNLF